MWNTTPNFTASISINVNGDENICYQCVRAFRSNRGLDQHLRSSKQNTTANTLDELETTNDRNEGIEVSLKATNCITASPTNKTTYMWRKYPSHIVEMNVSIILEKIVSWKENVFLIPSGHVGKRYMNEWVNWWMMDIWLTIQGYCIQSSNSKLLWQKLQKKRSLKIIYRHWNVALSYGLQENYLIC